MKKPQEIRTIVDAHRQKYKLSCSPSLIELILKIEGRVGLDFYQLQDKYRNQNVGLEVFSGQTIKGITFYKHDLVKDGAFIARIQNAHQIKQAFAIYKLNDGNPFYHGWIVAEVKADELFLLSKYSELGNGEGHLTAESTLRISEATPPKMTDLLFYSLPSAPPK